MRHHIHAHRSYIPVLTAGLVLGALSLSACTSSSPTSSALPPTAHRQGSASCTPDGALPIAFVGSGRSNQPVPHLPVFVANLASQAFDANSRVAVFSTSGSPTLVSEGTLATGARNQTALEEDRGSAAARIESVLAASPHEPEADLLRAVTLGARWLNGAGEGGTLVIVDSGLSTTGLLDYREPGILTASPDEITSYLEGVDAIPDVEGLTVVIARIADTASPQAPLPEPIRRNVVKQYTDLFAAAGAACVLVDDTPATGSGPEQAPPVTAIEIPERPRWTTASNDGGREIVLTEAVLGFEPGSAVFRDTAQAERTLKGIAGDLRGTVGTITLTGTTANWGSRDYQIELSTDRATQVRLHLTRLGVEPSRLVTVGLGSDNPWHIPDTDSAGRLLPGPASQNRTVRIHLAK